jgi:hypothetical protein
MFPGACLDEAIGDDGLAVKGLVELPMSIPKNVIQKVLSKPGFQNTEQTDQSKLIQKQLAKPCGSFDNGSAQAYH